MIMNKFYLIVIYILTGVIGLCVGSFLNVVIYRVPENMSLANPPSHCPKCNYRLRWYDNIPVLSYIVLGGKCRSCKQHISFRYTAVEIANTVLWLICAFMYAETQPFYAVISAFVCSVCICVFCIDLEHMLIFDRFQIMLAVAAIAIIFFDVDFDWISHLIGFGAATLVFIGISLIMSKVLGRDAMGGGDVKFAMCSGLLLGWQRFLLMMLIASLTGSVYMLFRKRKDGESKEIPFGPFLSSGLVIAMLFGSKIIGWYWALFGL